MEGDIIINIRYVNISKLIVLADFHCRRGSRLACSSHRTSLHFHSCYAFFGTAQTVKSNAINGGSFQPTLTQHMANIHQNQTRVRASVNTPVTYIIIRQNMFSSSGACAVYPNTSIRLSYLYLSHMQRPYVNVVLCVPRRRISPMSHLPYQ